MGNICRSGWKALLDGWAGQKRDEGTFRKVNRLERDRSDGTQGNQALTND